MPVQPLAAGTGAAAAAGAAAEEDIPGATNLLAGDYEVMMPLTDAGAFMK